jgi:RimJ/RimL family protein N-acetyltransferase
MEQDADAMFERYASDATVTKFLGWPTHESVKDTRQFLQTYSNVLWNKHKVGPYLISDLESGMLLGSLHWIGFFK